MNIKASKTALAVRLFGLHINGKKEIKMAVMNTYGNMEV
jgi:hypothetical protein